MADKKKTLPRFSNPPVIETAISVEFQPLAGWDVRAIGQLWQELKTDFPDFEVVPPLPSQIEDFESLPDSPVQLRFTNDPNVEMFRCWFKNEDGTKLVQVQRDRLVFNWRKGAGGGAYPHYDESIRPTFLKELNRFKAFVEKNQLGVLEILQADVSYINHIDLGSGWNSPDDLPDVFPMLSRLSGAEILPQPEDISFDVAYRMPATSGRLRIGLRRAIRNSDSQQILQLVVVARGRPTGTSIEAAMQWIDTGREWVVRGFADFTSAKMHKLWKRTT
jgi:uncharacterized protein (TIGR04255 family)